VYMSIAVRRNVAPGAVRKTRSNEGNAGKRLFRTIALIGMLAASLWLGAQIRVNAADEASAATAHGADQPYVLHTVEPGDTLWEIAKRHLPEGTELSAFIHDIRLFNGMETSQLTAGHALKIPVLQ